MTDTPPADGGTVPEPATSTNHSDAQAQSELTRDQQVGHYIDMWKQTVAVQMHFNDIEWRIRGLAPTVATFALGAAGVAAKDGTRIGRVSLGSLVIVIGLLLWYAFYFVDRVWYHPLLKAAVKHGTLIEDEVKKSLPQAGMTAAITAGSTHYSSRVERILSRKECMQSDDKLVWFYKVGAAALTAAALALQIGVLVTTDTTAKSPAPSFAPTATRS